MKLMSLLFVTLETSSFQAALWDSVGFFVFHLCTYVTYQINFVKTKTRECVFVCQMISDITYLGCENQDGF